MSKWFVYDLRSARPAPAPCRPGRSPDWQFAVGLIFAMALGFGLGVWYAEPVPTAVAGPAPGRTAAPPDVIPAQGPVFTAPVATPNTA
jgi:hypothetical protein